MKKNYKMLFSLALVLVFCMLFSVNAFADDNVTVNKYLVMDAGAAVPETTFHFTIAPGTPVAGTEDTVEILAGIGTLATDSKFDITIAAGAATTAGAAGNAVTTNTSEKYATGTATLTLPTYTAPGIYRYVISETASTSDKIQNDEGTSRILDVYVGYNGSETPSVLGTVMHKNADDAISTPEGEARPAIANKSDGFINRYATQSIELSKTVTGNQGDRNKYFQFTLVIGTEAMPTDAALSINPSSSYTKTEIPNVGTNPTAFKVGTQTVYLKNGEKIILDGLAVGTGYTITEVKPTGFDYDVSSITTVNTTAGTKVESNVATGTIIADTATEDNNVQVAYTNNREGAVPTGIMLDIAPYVVMVLLAGAAFIFLTAKKRNAEN